MTPLATREPPSSTITPSFIKRRFPALDGLRAASILCVLSSHMLPLGPKFLSLNYSAGAMGMSLFFALSGFLITLNLLGGQTTRVFFIRRLSRILPLAYAYLLVVFLILTYKPTLFLGNLSFLENYFDSFLTSWNAHFWSLCVEVQFYLGIGLIVALFGVRSIWIVLLACFAITLMRISESAVIDIRTHLRGDEILAGASVAVLYRSGFLRHRLPPIWLLGAGLFWFLASSSFTGPLQYLRPYSSATVLAITICLVQGSVLNLLESRPLRYIAEISYALYVIHPATIHGWMNDGGVVAKYLVKRPVSFILTFGLAHLSTFYWEKRWISWGKSLAVRGSVNSHQATTSV